MSKSRQNKKVDNHIRDLAASRLCDTLPTDFFSTLAAVDDEIEAIEGLLGVLDILVQEQGDDYQLANEYAVLQDRRRELQITQYQLMHTLMKTGQKADGTVLATIPYEDYLQSSSWKAKREEVMVRAGSRCEACGTRHNLHVHHCTYEHRGSEGSDDLEVLCKSCHQSRHI